MRRLGGIRGFARALLFYSIPLAALAWCAGWQLGYRNDRLVWLYFIPAPVIALAGLLWCGLHPWRARRGWWLVTAFLTLLALFKVLALDMRWNTSSLAGGMRVVHWNIAQTFFGLDRALNSLASDRPDVLVLSECHYSPDIATQAQNILGLPHNFHDQGMALLSRYPFQPQGTIKLPGGRCWWALMETPRGPLAVAMVDLISHPTLDRSRPLNRLAQWVGRRPPEIPLLVMGDFNTPRDARAFRPLRTHLRNAYEVAGRGWPYSWPLPFPTYSLDHTWFNDRLRVTRYQLRASLLSDHLRQDMEIALPEPPAAPASR